MYCSLIKKLYRLSLALVFGLCITSTAKAQGIVTLGTETPAPASSGESADPLGNIQDPNKIPDEIALFESSTTGGLLSPGNTQQAAIPGEPKNNPASGPNGNLPGGPNGNVPVINQLNPLAGKGLPEANSANNNMGPGRNMPMPGAQPLPMPSAEDNGGLPKVAGNPLFPAAETVNQNILDQVSDEVFSQMSDIERQTALLTLELRREKIKNEIEAIKAQREKATNELKNADADRELKKLEWEKEQEKKIIEEQLQLKKMEFAFEKLRQENLLNEYKEQMLHEEQKWIKTNMEVYAQVAKAKEERDNWTTKYRDRLTQLVGTSERTMQEVQNFAEAQRREINDLQTQVSILKARLEAQQKMNPFGQDGGVSADGSQGGVVGTAGGNVARAPVKPTVKLSDLYVIMEITGQGETLLAKMMNRDGQKFLAKVGTKFKSGDVVDEITSTYIRTDNEGTQDFLYFSAGGVLDEEPENKAAKKALAVMSASEKKEAKTGAANPRGLITSSGVPGVSRDMMLR